MKKLVVMLAMVLGFSATAKADILIEPYLGYEFGKTSDPKGKFSGSALGARIAYKLPAFVWLGLDATMGTSGEIDWDASGSGTTDAKRETLSAVVGVDLPILLRAWAAYGFHNKLKPDVGSDIEGKNIKLGIGFTALPFVSLNLEYIKDEYDKPTGTDLKTENLMLSVSLPLEF